MRSADGKPIPFDEEDLYLYSWAKWHEKTRQEAITERAERAWETRKRNGTQVNQKTH